MCLSGNFDEEINSKYSNIFKGKRREKL